MELDTGEFLGEFLDEMNSYLRDLETDILSLEDNPSDIGTLNNIFRTAHSIKGMGAMMGFDKLEKLTHNMEDVLYDIRDGKAEVTQQVVELLFLCHDFLEKILFAINDSGTEEAIKMDNINQIIEKLHGLLEKRKGVPLCDVDGIQLNEDEMKSIKKETEDVKGKIYYYIVNLEKKAQMKKVRSFMIINNLKSNSFIIKTKPNVEKLRDDNYDMVEDTIYILLKSEEEETEISKNIEAVPTVEKTKSILIENIDKLNECNIEESDKDIEEAKIDAFLEEELVGAHEVEENNNRIDMSEYRENFLSEIEDNLKEIKRTLLKINDEDNLEIVMRSYRNIKSVNRISKLLDIRIMEELTTAILEIIQSYKKNELGLETRLIEFILAIVNLGLRWISNPGLEENPEYIENVKKEINEMKIFVVEKEVKKDEKIGQILKRISNLTDEDVKSIEEAQKSNPDKKFGEIAVENKNVKEDDTIKAVMIQNRKKSQEREREEETETKKTLNISNYIRVDSSKADELVDNIGELKIMQTQIEHAMLNEDIDLDTNMKNMVRMQRIIKKIQGIAMSFRMVALKGTFHKVSRTVRDTIKKLDKDIDFKIEGENTEIDKEIADRVLKLIIHLVKNSISHGIESTQKRLDLGKPEKGIVKLEAYQKKGFIHITISDDGQGINPQAIFDSAKQKGLVNENKNYSDKEKIDFIFYPGFSTAKEVGKISGRGVGMDVVKTELSDMGGKIEVHTEINKGSNFEMKIPINMSIIDGTLVKISGETYIIPTNNINEIVPRDEDYWVDMQGKKSMVKIRENLIPVIDLEKVFEKKLDLNDYKMLLVIESGDKLKSIIVDDILERREVVEKPLGGEYENIPYISGASILGDGRVSLILDVEKL